MADQHSGSKYNRQIVGLNGQPLGQVDIYSVLDAFAVQNPALQHAAKKILCAGIRNKGSFDQDCSEAIDAIKQAFRFNKKGSNKL